MRFRAKYVFVGYILFVELNKEFYNILLQSSNKLLLLWIRISHQILNTND